MIDTIASSSKNIHPKNIQPNDIRELFVKRGMPCFLIGFAMIASTPTTAEEYMKRGASVEDYQQALGRVLERKRGIVTARERQNAAAAQQRKQAAARTQSSPVASGSASSEAHGRGEDVYSPDGSDEGPDSDGVSIYFGYDSANLTRAAQEELRKLGTALRAPEFAGVYWLIEGHTDASGTSDYNQQLSEARAASARRFLIDAAEVPPDRLITVGKGESQLYDKAQPAASVNRRVRLKPIGGTGQTPTEKASPQNDAPAATSDG